MRPLLLGLLLAAPALADDFSAPLYGQMAKRPGNLFFAPYSIQRALIMTSGGARSTTQAEMMKVIGTNTTPTIKAPGFQEANRVWVDASQHLLPRFIQYTSRFGPPAITVDFQKASEKARESINGWVAQKTGNHIQGLLPKGSVNSTTRLVLANALYFKDVWQHPFKPASTHPAPFYLVPQGQSEMQRMYQRGSFRYGKDAEVAVAELPYRGDFSLSVILPHTKAGIHKLQAARLHDYLALPKKKPTEIEVMLPRFKVESQYGLKEELSRMGMPTAFTPAANFGHIGGNTDLYINQVYHGGFIQVNEEGTEAAAATAVVVATKGGAFEPPKKVPSFNVDHPFLYVLRHRSSGAILFMGRVMKP